MLRICIKEYSWILVWFSPLADIKIKSFRKFFDLFCPWELKIKFWIKNFLMWCLVLGLCFQIFYAILAIFSHLFDFLKNFYPKIHYHFWPKNFPGNFYRDFQKKNTAKKNFKTKTFSLIYCGRGIFLLRVEKWVCFFILFFKITLCFFAFSLSLTWLSINWKFFLISHRKFYFEKTVPGEGERREKEKKRKEEKLLQPN